MTTLDQLDALLLTGALDLGPAFRGAQLQYVRRCQLPDGGFPGRRGGADRYYTDFALRLVVLLGGDEVVCDRAAGYLRALPEPRDLIEVFCALNASRLLMSADIIVSCDHSRLHEVLLRQAVGSGGFAKSHGGPVSAYATFLASLCCEMLALGFPEPGAAAEAVLALRGEGGGFREVRGSGPEQTNATAAAVGFLNLTGALPEEVARGAARFLESMPSLAGGLRAHAAAPCADLLSTFTGLVALVGLPEADRVDLGALARFAGELAQSEGGFAATKEDLESDLEYTYYGVATLALLRAILPRAA